MKKFIIAIFCISITVTSFSQNNNADAVYLEILKEYTLNENGSIDFHYSKELKLLTHFSFHRLYGEIFIIYNTDFQDIKINSCYTIMADGKKITTPDNAFNEVLPRFSTNAPAYNNLRELVVTHTGLEQNSIINLDYTLNSKKGYYSNLMGMEVLSETSPVNKLVVKVNIPDSKVLNYELLNFISNPIIENKNGKKSYTWTFDSIPANSKDYYQESNHESVPRLIFSTANDLHSAYDNFINQDAFVFNTNESMDKYVDDIVTNEADKLTTALKLQQLVCNNLSTLNIPLKYTGFKCRTAIETWNSNMGTHLEKAILLTTLLHKANIYSEVVTIIPDKYFNKEIGNILTFNSFLVRIKLKKYGVIYISPTHINKQNLMFALEGKTVLLLDKNIESLKVFQDKPVTNKIFMSGDFVFQNTENLTGKINLELKGEPNQYFTLYNDSSKITSTIKGIGSSKNFTSSKIVKLTQEICKAQLEFEKEDPFVHNSNYLSFTLPYVSNGIESWHINQLPTERSAPLELPQNIHERYEYAIVTPEDFKLVSNLKNIEIKNNVGYLLIEFVKTANELIVTREIEFKEKIIEINDYDEFREIMNTWNNNNYKKLIFKKL